MMLRAALTSALLTTFALSGCANTTPSQTASRDDQVRDYGFAAGQKIGNIWGSIRTTKPQNESIVSLTLDREGRLIDAAIEKSSGSAALDEETLAAVHRAAPFGKIPDSHLGETMPMKLHFCFAVDQTTCSTSR